MLTLIVHTQNPVKSRKRPHISARTGGLRVPDDAVPLILLQRTQYLLLPRLRLIWALRRLIPGVTLINAARFEAKFRKRQIAHLYALDMQHEFETFKHFLPQHVDAVLDIGCGLAGIDVHIYNHFAPRQPHVYLLDKTQLDSQIHHGFEDTGSFYNSLESAEALLMSNGIPKTHIHSMDASHAGQIPFNRDFNVILSLLSWGFHYPIGTYLESAQAHLAPGGRLIVDVRKDRGGEQLLQSTFRHVQVIKEGRRSRRVVAMQY
jgi:hypothetical protein